MIALVLQAIQVEGKYVYDNNTMETYFVNKCENGKIVLGTAKYEKVLSMTNDDYGTSYYYRGKVEDNYVNFAGMCWRIVRIVGDGSIKLILEDQYTTCNDTEDTDEAETVDYAYTGNWNIGSGNYGYDSSSKSTSGYAINKMSYLKPVTNANSSMVKAFFDFQTNKLSEYLNKLKSGDWCLADTAYSTRSIDLTTTPLTSDEINARHLARSSFYYDSYVRLIGNSKKSPTLKCNGTILNEFAEVTNVSSQEPMYVSTITADEIMYAGGKYNSSNYNYYLINNYAANSHSFYSLSPSYFESSVDLVVDVRSDGIMYNTSVYNQSFRPSVSLAAGTQITGGDGTITTPYEIKID